MLAVYPWQEADYAHLVALAKRLPSAVLLYGLPGLGSGVLARCWIAWLLCEQPVNNSACGSCRACVLLTQQSHPDFYQLLPSDEGEKKNKTISIGEVRAMMEFLSLTSHLSNRKIVLIEDTELLNLNSANALLKVLEEPPPGVLFILLSHNLARVMPTIKSRCHKYAVAVPSYTSAANYLADKHIPNYEFWLTYHANCPLFEVELSPQQLEIFIATLCSPSVENIFRLTAEVDGKAVSFKCFIEFMLKWLSDLASYKSTKQLNYFALYQAKIQPLWEKLQLEKIFYLSDKLNFLALWTNHPVNYKLQIENILLQYQQLFVK